MYKSFSYFLLSIFGAILVAANPTPKLSWDVYLAPGPAINGTNLAWSQTAFTLIHGSSSSILVDAPITGASANALADWIERTAPGVPLTYIYITHGHGDHFFGVTVLQQRFPGVKVIARADVLAHAEDQVKPATFDTFWGKYFPGQIPSQDFSTWEVLERHQVLSLEGHRVVPVEVGQSDTYNTTVLHIPSLDLVVAGDVVYGSYFQYLAESTTDALREQWIESIDRVGGLRNVKFVVPSHKQDSDDYGLEHLETTKTYLKTWGEQVKVATSAADLQARIHKLYPKREGDFILFVSASAYFP